MTHNPASHRSALCASIKHQRANSSGRRCMTLRAFLPAGSLLRSTARGSWVMSKCVAALLALALGGCAVYTLQTPLQDLRIGYTTTADVERMLGRPTRRTITQAGEEYW